MSEGYARIMEWMLYVAEGEVKRLKELLDDVTTERDDLLAITKRKKGLWKRWPVRIEIEMLTYAKSPEAAEARAIDIVARQGFTCRPLTQHETDMEKSDG